jgi:hypothetical protein
MVTLLVRTAGSVLSLIPPMARFVLTMTGMPLSSRACAALTELVPLKTARAFVGAGHGGRGDEQVARCVGFEAVHGERLRSAEREAEGPVFV